VPARFDGKVALITGASAGIGEALAREILARGGAAVLFARRAERVAALAAELGERAVAIPGDVTRDGDVARAIAAGRDRFGSLDSLVANAGFGVSGDVADLSLDDFRRQFETNVFGVLRSVQEPLPALRESRGTIGIVGSVNGYVSIPGWSAYCMSKHAVRSLAACLRAELRASGVSVTHLAPGFIESDFRRTDNQSRLQEGSADPVPAWLTMPADRAARAMVTAVLARRAEAVVTVHGKVAVGAQRHVPAVVGAALRAGAGIAEKLGRKG
jgi:short-subunit dehydrogenase